MRTVKITIPSDIHAGQNLVERYENGERTRTYQLMVGYWENGDFHETDTIVSTWESYHVVGPMVQTIKLLLELAADTKTDISIDIVLLYELSRYAKQLHHHESNCYDMLFEQIEKMLWKTYPDVADFFKKEREANYFEPQNLLFQDLVLVHDTYKVIFDFKTVQNCSVCCFYAASIQKYGNSHLVEHSSSLREYKKQILFKQLRDNQTQEKLQSFYEKHPGIRMKKLFIKNT